MQNHPSTITTNGNPIPNEDDMFREIFVAGKKEGRDDFFVGGGNAINNILARHRDADDLETNSNHLGLGEEIRLQKSESHQFLTVNEP